MGVVVSRQFHQLDQSMRVQVPRLQIHLGEQLCLELSWVLAQVQMDRWHH